MNKPLLGLAVLLACAAAQAQEIARGIVTIPTRPGVTQSFFVAGMGRVKPQAARATGTCVRVKTWAS